MAIADTDILILLSTKSGAAGYATSSTPAASLGKYCSTSEMGTGLNSLFDDVSGAENAATEDEYRCVFVLNNHATLDYQDAVVYVSSQVAGGTDITIAVDDITASAKDSASAQAAEIADEDTAPTGVGSFSAPTTSGTGLSIGTLSPGEVRAVWVKRTTTDSAALDADGVTLAAYGDSAA